MTTALWWASGAGLVLAGGLWLCFGRWGGNRRSHLVSRVAPWVSDVSWEAHEISVSRAQRRIVGLRGLPSFVNSRLPRRLANLMEGSASDLSSLLARAGRDETLERWRLTLIQWALGGFATGLVFSVLLTWAGGGSPVSIPVLALVGAAIGVLLRRYLLAKTAAARTSRMLNELPVLCELVAICLTAGEGLPQALRRIARRGVGPLSREVAQTLEATDLGVPLIDALGALSQRLDISELSRTLDHVISGIERGTPLADVLRVQANEARGEAGRRLQERASAREVVMLIPLVFLILPITIAFAIFPGLLVIQAGL